MTFEEIQYLGQVVAVLGIFGSLVFKIWQNAYYQYKSGFLTEHNWDSNYKWMLTWFHMPGVQIWWRVRRDLFANEFQDFLEASRRPDSGRPLPEILRAAAKAAAASE